MAAMTLAQKVGRCLAATADAAHFNGLGLVDPQFPGRVDDAGTNTIMAAAFTERRGATFILIFVQANDVDFGGAGWTLFWCVRCIGTQNISLIFSIIVTVHLSNLETEFFSEFEQFII